MRHTVSRLASRTVAAALIGALALSSLPATAAQAASPKSASAQVSKPATTTTDFSARRYRRSGNPAAAIAAFGLVAGAIIAAQRRNDYYDRGYGYYGGGYGYGYGRPYYGYRHYHRGYRYW